MPKTSELTSLSTMTADDLLVGLNDPAGTPGTRNFSVPAVAARMIAAQNNSRLMVATLEGAVANGTTDDTAAIQTMLDALNSAGGGVAYFPPGTYGVKGDGTASHGALRVYDNTAIVGAGMGATVFKLLNSQAGSDLTGIIRTPTGVQTKNCIFRDFSINGNIANVTDRIIGFYLGVTPSIKATVSVSGTTATFTTASAHGFSSSEVKYIRSETEGLNGDFTITVTGSTTFTATVVSGTPSDATGYTWVFDDPYATAADENIYVENVEIYGCQAYAFDPHELVRGLRMVGCIAHDNGPDGDGFTLDGVFDSTLTDCLSYDNDRNGFNLVTGTSDVTLMNCHAFRNAQYGFADQRGSTTIPRNRNNKFIGCTSFENTEEGFRLLMPIGATISNCTSRKNGRRGIKLDGAKDCVIHNNIIKNNSQTTTNTYDEIQVAEYAFAADSVTYASSNNKIQNNLIREELLKAARYSIREETDSSNANLYFNNDVSGAATSAYSVPSDSYVVKQPSSTGNVTVRNDGVFDASLTATIAWDGTAPSGASDLRYSWQQIGGWVFAQFRLEYATAGATNTQVSIELPSDMPLPTDFTGTASTEVMIAGTGNAYTGMTGNGSAAKVMIYKDSGSSTGYYIWCRGFTSGAMKGASIFIAYPAASGSRL